ncbi:hypothetical protein [Lentzea nigeriaca]|uniref:hypothetical protein n=1 Tax=Lentzea nigeriaca TaxID=1128665 RepID=UPI0019571618|nr:hypothetical protein [Lentzea nigeriaca]MBM7860417.1 hypothetical protein [Lentzea nigeriaca]
MDRQYTPDEIEQLPPTPSNRGRVMALKRFGDPAARTAAQSWLNRHATAQQSSDGPEVA